MKIIFIGTVEFSRRTLAKLIEMEADIVGVCTLEMSTFNADHSDLSKISSAQNIPWIYVSDINSEESIQWITDKEPDVIFCFGWSRLLEKIVLNIAPLGVVGFHPAKLPANRGRHPIIWALVLGLKETASTFFFMDEEADRGDVLTQRVIEIEESDDAKTLYEKVVLSALDQIQEFVPQLSSGSFSRVVQTGHINTWRKRNQADGQIDWRMSARSIYNLVRGLTKPYIGAHFLWQGKEIKVWKATIVNNAPQNIEPGKIYEVKAEGTVVKCGEDGILLIKTESSFNPTIGEYL